MKQITKFKRLLSGVLSAVMTVSAVPIVSAHADESTEPYPYTMFAASSDDGAITVNAGNFCVNGNVATKGTIVSSGNMNINGTRTENADESMIFIFDKIDNQYFSASNVDEYDEDYTLDELNININVPTEVQGEATLTGNININNALKALEDVNLYGEVKNTNDSVIFSKYGDIVIDSQNVNLNGLVYAPFGSVTINAQNLNLNNVVIIAESIILTCPNVNANNSSNASSFVGTTSDPLDIPYDEWQYMKDENENAFPDFFENSDNWRLLKDTDGDQLPDCVEQFIGTDATLVDSDSDMLDDYYEVFVTGTDPVLPDTDNNGIADGDEDFDTDGLTNYQEYIQGTSPWDSDSDSDDLSDGDEVNIYSTNPLEPDTDNDGLSDSDEIALGTNPNLPDTDGDGTLDGQERFAQTYVYNVSEEGCAVEQVIVSMEGTGNLQNTMSVDNIMDKDVICSGVVGLVGVPFSIETTSDFETATLSFKIDQSKLGDTDFNDLLFLWYDEDNHNFVELDTIYDETNSTVSIETTHFSRYMVVDKYSWFGAWSKELNYTSITYEKSAVYSVLAVDCSGSMSTYDPITIISPNSAPYKPVYSCERQKAVSGFTSALDFDDKAAIVTFESSASTVCELTDDTYELYWGSAAFYNGGGTNFDAALRKSIDILQASSGSTRKRIILLSDGYSSVSDSILNELKADYIKVYTIGIGNCSDTVLSKIATETGGEYIKAYKASDLVDIYANIGIGGDFDTTDNDGDGLYDAVESAGIRLQNGNIIYTDPTTKHTDSDGLEDGEEINPTPKKSEKIEYNDDGTVKTVKGYYFVMKSDPREEDTDGDGALDFEDATPSNYNEKMSYIFTKTDCQWFITHESFCEKLT
ncbi:VWA domain-containing protein [Ruminococcus flavefaciens]|uniref:vWA domain-containing protein n=1 Tax=Ruminococcus flavefaciens TaxID=1265 RepID=UPI001565FBBE|nr:VWA domain-containing protein [Ruminococcus flavefaciens]